MKCLVTGGGGFLGKAIVSRLLERGDHVRAIARGDYPELTDMGAECIRGDIADLESCISAVEGCDMVFHVAAKAGVWGSYESYYQSNVVGTQNIVKACQRAGVQKLVYTSTPSVIHAGGDVEGVDESLPYPEHFETHYPKTKAMAEKFVLAANSPNLATVALRPHLIWGPGDNHLVPRIVERGRTGQLRFVGDGQNLIDSIYIDNAADAHILAGDRLGPEAPCAGKAYFISQGEPVPSSQLINGILESAGVNPVTRSIHPTVAYVVGAVMEAVYSVAGIESEPKMTRFLAKQLSTAHWYDISAAKRDLGFEPTVSIREGLDRLTQWFDNQGSTPS